MVWTTLCSPSTRVCLGRPSISLIVGVLALLLVLPLVMRAHAFGQDVPGHSAEEVAEQAKAVWESGSPLVALELLDQAIQAHPEALALNKLRGDILATFRGPTEAVQAYDVVLSAQPSALDVRWAKWSVLVWSGQDNEVIAELRHIAQIDSRNPLAHFRLAQELRKVDRLEESIESYQHAIQLMPDIASWRLALARARFDVLDYQGAEAELRTVLQRLPPGHHHHQSAARRTPPPAWRSIAARRRARLSRASHHAVLIATHAFATTPIKGSSR